jgi:hypothetical protein
MNWKTFIIIILAVACVSLATSRLLHKCPVPIQQTFTTQSGKPDKYYVKVKRGGSDFLFEITGTDTLMMTINKKWIKIGNNWYHNPAYQDTVDLGEIVIHVDEQDTLTDYVSEKSFVQPIKYGVVNSLVRVQAKCPADLMSDSVTVDLNMAKIKDEILSANKPSKTLEKMLIGGIIVETCIIIGHALTN